MRKGPYFPGELRPDLCPHSPTSPFELLFNGFINFFQSYCFLIVYYLFIFYSNMFFTIKGRILTVVALNLSL